jgi:hypothetical protein
MPEQEDSPARAWPRAQRLNATRLARELHVQTGLRLAVEDPRPGGEVGAAHVRWPGGHLAVLRWQPHGKLADVKHGALAIAEALRLADRAIRHFDPTDVDYWLDLAEQRVR